MSNTENGLLKRYWIAYRRFRLESAYEKIAKAKRPQMNRVGFTPTMATWHEMEEDDIIEIEDGELTWKWP